MRCPGPMRQEPSFQENAAEERQTEGFLDCHANIVENSASAAIRAEPNRRLAKISLRKNHLETFARRSSSMKQRSNVVARRASWPWFFVFADVFLADVFFNRVLLVRK